MSVSISQINVARHVQKVWMSLLTPPPPFAMNFLLLATLNFVDGPLLPPALAEEVILSVPSVTVSVCALMATPFDHVRLKDNSWHLMTSEWFKLWEVMIAKKIQKCHEKYHLKNHYAYFISRWWDLWAFAHLAHYQQMSSKFTWGLFHQMSWKIFQSNMVTFHDTWWYLVTFHDIWWYFMTKHVVFGDISWHNMSFIMTCLTSLNQIDHITTCHDISSNVTI